MLHYNLTSDKHVNRFKNISLFYFFLKKVDRLKCV